MLIGSSLLYSELELQFVYLKTSRVSDVLLCALDDVNMLFL